MPFTYAQANEEMRKEQSRIVSYIRIMSRWTPEERKLSGYNSAEEVLQGIRKQFDRLEKEYQKIEAKITEE